MAHAGVRDVIIYKMCIKITQWLQGIFNILSFDRPNLHEFPQKPYLQMDNDFIYTVRN